LDLCQIHNKSVNFRCVENPNMTKSEPQG
jgi:hypothetical protein